MGEEQRRMESVKHPVHHFHLCGDGEMDVWPFSQILPSSTDFLSSEYFSLCI